MFSPVIDTCSVSGFSGVGVLAALGRSTLTWCVISGAVMMKMISRTSITSTSGVMLISAVGIWLADELKEPIAISGDLGGSPGAHRVDLRAVGDKRLADREEGMQIVGKGVEIGQHDAVRAGEGVVGKDGGQGDGEAGGGHDQRLADRAGDLLQRRLAGQTDGDQCVVDAPYGTKQADERRRSAGRREQGQADCPVRLGG